MEPSNVEAALLSVATLLPEFEEAAALYERDPERDVAMPLHEQARHVSRMALTLWGVRLGAPNRSATPGLIEHFTMREYPDMAIEKKLRVRRYNVLLAKLWSECAAMHPGQAVSDVEGREVAVAALTLARATLQRATRASTSHGLRKGV